MADSIPASPPWAPLRIGLSRTLWIAALAGLGSGLASARHIFE
jgi:hypothetical protein